MKVQIEKTSKPLKSVLLLANAIQVFAILGFIGAISAETDPTPALGLLLFGIVLHVLTRALVWWQHG